MSGQWRAWTRWAVKQTRQSWWLLPLQPVVALTVLAAGIVAIWPGLDFAEVHSRLNPVIAHGWMGLGILAPSMTLVSYSLILRCRGLVRYAGFWLRLGGDIGQFVVLATFVMMHVSATDNDEDVYVAVCFAGALVALLMMVVRDVWEIALTEQLTTRIHRGRDE